MALVEARKEGRLGGYSMGDRNFCNAYRNFCRPNCGDDMRFSPCAAPFRSLFVRRRPFTLSDAKLTFCAQCAIIVGPFSFNKIARQRILQSTTMKCIKHDNK